MCGGEIHSQMGNFSSPGYPNTPYIPEDQHDDSMRCHWRLRPQDPSVRFIKITLVNFFLGRKDYRGRCRLVLCWKSTFSSAASQVFFYMAANKCTLFDGLTDNKCGYYTSCVVCFPPRRGEKKMQAISK